jgi:hypothetical protein
MVLIALLYIPCMVLFITIGLPLLLVATAVFAIPVLLCYMYQQSKIRIDTVLNVAATCHTIDATSRTNSSIASAEQVHVTRRTMSINSSLKATANLNAEPKSSLKKKKVSFQTSHDVMQRKNDHYQQQKQSETRTIRLSSARISLNSSLCQPISGVQTKQKQYQYDSYNDNRDASHYVSLHYHNTRLQYNPTSIYCHPHYQPVYTR